MGMERGGFGNGARSASFVERVCLTAVCARDCWAGAAAAAAGCGLLGSTDLLASALRTSVAMAGLFDVKVPKKGQLVLLLLGGRDLSIRRVLSRRTESCACCCRLLRACSCHVAGAFVGSVCEQEQHVRTLLCAGHCCVRAEGAVGCSAVLVRAVRVGDAWVGSAGGLARCARVNRAR